jgi:hypothetical protein
LDIATRRPWRAALLLLLPLASAAALHAAAARDPRLVEGAYSLGLYRWIGAGLATAFGRLPFSLAEALVLAVIGGAPLAAGAGLVRILRARGRRLRALGGGALLVACCLAWLYLAFLLAWGLHYQRVPLATSAGLDVGPASVAELSALCGELVERANALRPRLGEDAHGVMRLGAPRQTLVRAEAGYAAAAHAHPLLRGRYSRPKPVRLSVAMSYLGITGIFFPFTGEANVNTTVPAPDLPFTICHEMAHQRGFAREDEASFVGYIACGLHPDAEFRYSAVLAAGEHALARLWQADRDAWRRIAGRRAPGVRRDLEALREWSERYAGPAERAGRAVNDAYLRSRGDARGIASYGELVDLLIAERRKLTRDRPTAPAAP